MAKLKKLKKRNNFGLLIFLLIIAAFAVVYVNNYVKATDVKTIPYDFSVGDNIAFNLDPDSMHFGTTIKGTRVFRNIIIEPDKDYNVRVLNKGPDFLYLSEEKFMVFGGEKNKIRVYLQIPSDAEEKLYEGELTLIFEEI